MPANRTVRGRRSWREGAIALSLAVHAAILLALVSSLPPREPLPEPPVFNVQMTPQLSRPPPELPSPPVPPVIRRPREDPLRPLPPRDMRPAPLPPVAPVGQVQAPAAPPPPGSAVGTTPSASPAPGADAVRDGLRVSVGCDTADLLGLTRREREACDERRGARNRLAEEDDLPPSLAERQRRDARAVARNPRPKGPALVRAPGEGPQNHPVVGLPPVMVGATVPFGAPPKAITPIPPSTLRGDDDALRPRTTPQ